MGEVGDKVGAGRGLPSPRQRVGVGARRSETKSISVVSVSWPTAGDYRDAAGGDGADDDFLVKGHQVFQTAAAAGDDQYVGAGRIAALGHCVKAGDGRGDAFGGALALHGARAKPGWGAGKRREMVILMS